jgi:F0F1-type ATP synthase membrane subunit b/b'
MLGFWLSLAVLVAAVAAGLAFAIVRGFHLYRLVKRTGSAFSPALERIAGASASIERQLAAAEASGHRLAEASERLRVSRAQLDVQQAAVREARAQVRRMLWFIPGV